MTGQETRGPTAQLSVTTPKADRVEPGEHDPIAVAFGEDRLPRKACLRTLEDKHLEELAVVADRISPLAVVIANGKSALGPAAAPAVRRGLRGGLP